MITIGSKVKHVNSGDHIYTVEKLHGSTATLLRPKELYSKLYPKIKTSPIITKSICRIENLIEL